MNIHQLAAVIGFVILTPHASHADSLRAKVTDIKQLYAMLAAASPKKTEFETNAEFLSRRNSEVLAKFSSSELKSVAFELSRIGSGGPLPTTQIKFDAEKGAIVYETELYPRLMEERTTLGKREASNAFGATVTVIQETSTSYAVHFRYALHAKIFAPVNKLVAQQNWPFLSAYLGGDLIAPYVTSETTLKTASCGW